MIVRPSAISFLSCQKLHKVFTRSYSVSAPLGMASKELSSAVAQAHDFLDFVNASPTRT